MRKSPHREQHLAVSRSTRLAAARLFATSRPSALSRIPWRVCACVFPGVQGPGLQIRFPRARVLIIIGGSPCVDISGFNPFGKGVDGGRQSSLVHEFVRILILLGVELGPAARAP